MQPYPRSPDLVWPGYLHGTGCLSARAMDTGFPTVAPLAPSHSWHGCAVWVCVIGLGFRLRPATPGWGVGLCVCSACTQPLLATGARCGCVCLGSGFGCAPPLLAGVLGCVRAPLAPSHSWPRVRGVGVCVWAPASAAPRHSWLGCWAVCMLRLHPATPGLRCAVWVCVFALGFRLRPATPGWGVGLCVCSACTQPLLARCAVWVCVFGLGFRLRPATPGWGVGLCACSACTQPLLATGARCGCVCLGSGFGCAPPLLAGVFPLCVCSACTQPLLATGARCGSVCLGSGFRCAPPLLAGLLGCVCAPLAPSHSWPRVRGVGVCDWLGRVGRAGLPGAFWCASPFLWPFLVRSLLVWPPPGSGCPVCGCCWVFFFFFFCFFSPSPPRCAPVLSCFACFPAPGAFGLCVLSPPPLFFLLLPPPPPSVPPVVFCFACFPAWGALGLGVLLPQPPPFFFFFFVCCRVVLCCGALSSFFVFLPAGGAGFLLFPVGSGLLAGSGSFLFLCSACAVLCWRACVVAVCSVLSCPRGAGWCFVLLPVVFVCLLLGLAVLCCLLVGPGGSWCRVSVACCGVSLGAVLRRFAAHCVVVRRVVSFCSVWCCRALCCALGRCPSSWGPVPSGAVFCFVPPLCVCFAVVCRVVVLFAVVLCAVCALGCRAVRFLSSPPCAVLLCGQLSLGALLPCAVPRGAVLPRGAVVSCLAALLGLFLAWVWLYLLIKPLQNFVKYFFFPPFFGF